MGPCSLRSFDAWVRSCIGVVRLDVSLSVGRGKVLFIVSWTVTNDYLWRVFVGHNYRCNWQSTPVSVWIIWSKWLVVHTSMVNLLLLICVSHRAFNFAALVKILITTRILPPGLFKWESYGEGSTLVISDDMRASWNSCIFEKLSTFILLLSGEFFRIVNESAANIFEKIVSSGRLFLIGFWNFGSSWFWSKGFILSDFILGIRFVSWLVILHIVDCFLLHFRRLVTFLKFEFWL